MHGLVLYVIFSILCGYAYCTHVFDLSLSLAVKQLVDFEAMTTPSPDRFSKTAKSWMSLKGLVWFPVSN